MTSWVKWSSVITHLSLQSQCMIPKNALSDLWGSHGNALWRVGVEYMRGDGESNSDRETEMKWCWWIEPERSRLILMESRTPWPCLWVQGCDNSIQGQYLTGFHCLPPLTSSTEVQSAGFTLTKSRTRISTITLFNYITFPVHFGQVLTVFLGCLAALIGHRKVTQTVEAKLRFTYW